MQRGQLFYRLGKGLLIVAGLSAAGIYASCELWSGNTCPGALIGGLVVAFTLVPGVVCFIVGMVMTHD